MVEWHHQSVDTCLSKLQEIMKDREAWRAVFMGSKRVRYDCTTEQQQYLGMELVKITVLRYLDVESMKSVIFISVSFLGLNSREILVYKNCTFNCTFLYRAEEPQETPRRKTTHRFNSFYWVHCCGSNMCNFGGPTNLERDITLDYPLEEDIEGNAQLVQSTVFLSIVSILVRNTLT